MLSHSIIRPAGARTSQSGDLHMQRGAYDTIFKIENMYLLCCQVIYSSLYLCSLCSCQIDWKNPARHGDRSVHLLARVSAVQPRCSDVPAHRLHPVRGEAGM